MPPCIDEFTRRNLPQSNNCSIPKAQKLYPNVNDFGALAHRHFSKAYLAVYYLSYSACKALVTFNNVLILFT